MLEARADIENGWVRVSSSAGAFKIIRKTTSDLYVASWQDERYALRKVRFNFVWWDRSFSCVLKARVVLRNFNAGTTLKTELVTVEGKTSSECVIFKTNQKLHRSRFLKGNAQFAVCDVSSFTQICADFLFRNPVWKPREALLRSVIRAKNNPPAKRQASRSNAARPGRNRWQMHLSKFARFANVDHLNRQNVDQNWSKCSETIFRKYSTVPSEASKHTAPTPRNFELVRWALALRVSFVHVPRVSLTYISALSLPLPRQAFCVVSRKVSIARVFILAHTSSETIGSKLKEA